MASSADYATSEGLEILCSDESTDECGIIVQELVGGSESELSEAVGLLTRLALFSPRGHARALHILNQWQVGLGKRYLLQAVIYSFTRAEQLSTGLHILRLLNALLASEGASKDKCDLRNQIIGLKFVEVLEDKVFRKSELLMGEFREQVRRFHELKGSEQGLSSPDGVDLNNPNQLCQAIIAQVANSPNEPIFLNILRSLLLLDPSHSLNDEIWSAIERLVDRARLAESKEEVEKIVRVQTSAVYMTKARTEKIYESSSFVCKSCGDSRKNCGPPEPPPLSGMPPPAPPLPPLPPPITSEPPEAPPAPGTFADLLNKKSKGLQSSSKRKIADKSATLPSSPKSGKLLIDSTDGQENSLDFPSPRLPAPRSKLKGFAWNKVPKATVVAANQRGEGNIWTRAADHLKRGLHLDFGKLEELFTQESPSTPGIGDKKSFATLNGTPSSLTEERLRKRDEVTLLSHKRNFSVNIFLKQFKDGINNLMGWIEECRGEDIGLEKLKALAKILPQREEAETLRKYDGEQEALGVAEKFLLRLIQIEHYDVKIESMLLKEEFASTIDYVRESLRIVLDAGQELKGCKELEEFMSLVLVAGNFMNAGSYSGNAVGFKMTSLWKLSEIRSTINSKMTLLHFVVQEAESRNPGLLELPNLLKLSSEADKVSVDTIKSDVRSLRTKMQKVSRELDSVPQIKYAFGGFLNVATKELSEVETSVIAVDKMRLKLAEFLCEDQQGFKLEECFKVFHQFSNLFSKAVEENAERRIQEKKQELRKRLQDGADQKKCSGTGDGTKSSLREKYGLAPGDASDLTLRLERNGSMRNVSEMTPQKSSDLMPAPSSVPVRTQRPDHSGEALMEFLEKGNDGNNIDDSLENNPWVHSIRRGRVSTKPRRIPLQGIGGSESRERKVGWRERVEQLMQEEEELSSKSPSASAPGSNQGSAPQSNAGSLMASSESIDKPREYCNPIFARQKIVRTGSAKLSSISDLSTVAESSEARFAVRPRDSSLSLAGETSVMAESKKTGSNSDLSPSGSLKRERWRKTRSLYAAAGTLPIGDRSPKSPVLPSPTSGPNDLDSLLSQMESEQNRNEIQVRGKTYRWRASDTSASYSVQRSASLSGQGDKVMSRSHDFDLQCSQTITEDPVESVGRTDIDEVVRECEKTKVEIDNIGLAVDTSDRHDKWGEETMRDSGICEFQPAEKYGEVPKISPLLSQTFTYTASIENIDRMSNEDIGSARNSEGKQIGEMAERKGDGDSSDEQWRSVTDVSDGETGTPPRSPVCSSAGGERDEGFETESHSTVSSNVGGPDGMDLTTSPPPSSFDSANISLSLDDIVVNENPDISAGTKQQIQAKPQPTGKNPATRGTRRSPPGSMKPTTGSSGNPGRSSTRVTNPVQKSGSSSSTASSQRGGRPIYAATRTAELRAQRAAANKTQTDKTQTPRTQKSSVPPNLSSAPNGGNLMKRFVNTLSQRKTQISPNKQPLPPKTIFKPKGEAESKPPTPRMSRVRSAANRPPSAGSTSSSQNTSPTRSTNVSRQPSSSSVLSQRNTATSKPVAPRPPRQRMTFTNTAIATKQSQASSDKNRPVAKKAAPVEPRFNRSSVSAPQGGPKPATVRKSAGKTNPLDSASSDSGKKPGVAQTRRPKPPNQKSLTPAENRMLEYPSRKSTTSSTSNVAKSSSKTWERLKSPPQRGGESRNGDKASGSVAPPAPPRKSAAAKFASVSPSLNKSSNLQTGGVGRKAAFGSTATERITRIWR